VKTIVASHNPDLAHDFDRDLLRRRDLRLVTARDTDDLVAKLREGADLCFVDRVLPDGDAESALAAIRADKRFAAVPVVLVTSAGAPVDDRAAAQAAGFADIVELPAAPGVLGLLVGQLLGVPLREDERFAVRVHVFSEGSDAESYIGTSVDLSEHGMLLKARRSTAPGTLLDVRFALPGRTGELSLQGRVVRVDSTFAPAFGLALAFESPTASDAAALREYLRVLLQGRPFSWRTVAEPNRTVVELYGVLRADSDLSALAGLAQQSTPLYLRLRSFRRISSDSVQKWIDFVRALPESRRIVLLECPIPFIHQANLITNLLEHQTVESFFAPYSCHSCGLDEERLLTVAELGPNRKPPAQICSACQAQTSFDELPEQYFAFLDR
jgi:CheY-like chemotaxis protein